MARAAEAIIMAMGIGEVIVIVAREVLAIASKGCAVGLCATYHGPCFGIPGLWSLTNQAVMLMSMCHKPGSS